MCIENYIPFNFNLFEIFNLNFCVFKLTRFVKFADGKPHENVCGGFKL